MKCYYIGGCSLRSKECNFNNVHRGCSLNNIAHDNPQKEHYKTIKPQKFPSEESLSDVVKTLKEVYKIYGSNFNEDRAVWFLKSISIIEREVKARVDMKTWLLGFCQMCTAQDYCEPNVCVRSGQPLTPKEVLDTL